MAPSSELKKDNDGLWSATVGPLAPDLYEVQLNVDGLMIVDPGSSMPKPQRQVNTSLLEIPGDPPTFLDTHDVPHGEIRAEVYRSKALNVTRPSPGLYPAGLRPTPARILSGSVLVPWIWRYRLCLGHGRPGTTDLG
jgi:hypothetical protein